MKSRWRFSVLGSLFTLWTLDARIHEPQSIQEETMMKEADM